MEIIYILLLLVIIFLLVSNKNSYNEKIERLEGRIFDLQRDLQKQRVETRPAPEPPRPAEKIEEIKQPEVFKPVPPLPQPVFENAEKPRRLPPMPQIRKREPAFKAVFEPSEPRLSFFERHPDLEKFIGENLINKIGIAILVLAIGFFVKYAIDNNWVGPAGRVAIGVLCGAILIAIAHRLRNLYKAFSSVLVGGGLAVLYFTITLAYHQFHLFNQTTSFIILTIITCFAVALSLLYDKQELAVIALIGGLASPFMVSSGEANYNALFAYLVILNIGLLVIAYYKSWRILNISAFSLTVIVYSAILYTLTQPTFMIGFWYGTVLYLLYFAINIANNVKENKKFIASDFSILLINTSLYFAAGLYLLTAMHYETFRGLFSASLALVNLLLSYILFRNKKVDTNVLYLLIGITLTFISLTAPIQLHGHYITLFWTAEAVLLYWLYQKSTIELMKLTALVIWGVMIISLVLDWMNIYRSNLVLLPIIINKGFITTLFAAAGTALLFMLIEKDDNKQVYGIQITPVLYKYSALVLLFVSGILEINHQFLSRYPNTTLNILYLMLYIPAFVQALYLIAQKIAAIKPQTKAAVILLSATIIVYLFCYPQIFDLQYATLVQKMVSPLHFIGHWAAATIVVLLFYQLICIVRNSCPKDLIKTACWVLSATIVIFLSIEVSLATNAIFYTPATTLDRVATVFTKTGLPVLWGLLSFAIMWLGMHHKISTLRIISLTLFSITLLKLFIFDIKNIPPAGKIAAFFCLGLLLLIISFMYQKVKKIIVADGDPKQD